MTSRYGICAHAGVSSPGGEGDYCIVFLGPDISFSPPGHTIGLRVIHSAAVHAASESLVFFTHWRAQPTVHTSLAGERSTRPFFFNLPRDPLNRRYSTTSSHFSYHQKTENAPSSACARCTQQTQMLTQSVVSGKSSIEEKKMQ